MENSIGSLAAANDTAVPNFTTKGSAVSLNSDTSLQPPQPQAPPPQPAKQTTAWCVDFTGPKVKRKTTHKEREAMVEARLRRSVLETHGSPNSYTIGSSVTLGSETNSATPRPLNIVSIDGLADRDALVPTNLTTTRADLEARFVLRLPRMLCISKQYPRSCGVSSLTSIYNYLYSRIGESEVGVNRPPISQEEIMTLLGFDVPFGEIPWGSFTGNSTLMRWFHALNRNFSFKGRVSVLYKAHGAGKTTHLYESKTQVLEAVKAALRDPHCAIIYHCYNHYMVLVGYQDIPHAQVDFLQPYVAQENCDTTIFIGEVSRGKHEAMYARKWSDIVKDIECQSPEYFNIRHPELGIQVKEPGSRRAKGQKGKDNHTASPATIPAAAAAAVNADSEGNVVVLSSFLASASPNVEAVAVFSPLVVVVPAAEEQAGAAAAAALSSSEMSALTPMATAVPAVATADPDVATTPSVIAISSETATAAGAVETNAELNAPSPHIATAAPSPQEGEYTPTCELSAAEGMTLELAVAASASPALVAGARKKPLLSQQQKQREGRNLHCLILFRNDQVEEHPERFENPSSSSSSSSSSTHSDNETSDDEEENNDEDNT